MFYEGLRLLEAHLYVFYVSGRLSGGTMSKGRKRRGGFAEHSSICISHGDRLSSYDPTSFQLIMIPAPPSPSPFPHAREGFSLVDPPGFTASLEGRHPESLPDT